MARRQFTGEEVASALIEMSYVPIDRTGSHLKLRHVHPESGETRAVSVPMGGEIPVGTLRSIAAQCGADEFDAWCAWIDRHR